MPQPKDSKPESRSGEPKTWRPDTEAASEESTANRPKEYGGRENGLDPTRYGDWEKNGRCIDF